MKRLGLAAISLCSACAAGPRPPPEEITTPPQSTASPTPAAPPERPSPAPAVEPTIERDGPYVVERSGDRTCIGLPGHSTRLCGSRPRGPRTKIELDEVHGGLDQAAVWQGLKSMQSASKKCWDQGPEDIVEVEARVFVGPQGDVRSAETSRGGEVAACVLPLLRAATFPRAKESTRISARLVRVP